VTRTRRRRPLDKTLQATDLQMRKLPALFVAASASLSSLAIPHKHASKDHITTTPELPSKAMLDAFETPFGSSGVTMFKQLALILPTAVLSA
jgi:hypothetical protein